MKPAGSTAATSGGRRGDLAGTSTVRAVIDYDGDGASSLGPTARPEHYGYVSINGAGTGTTQYVDVESVRFTGAAIGISADADIITLTANTATVAGAVVSTSLDVNGAGDFQSTLTLQDSVTMSADSATITHSHATGSLAISSTNGAVTLGGDTHVDVESWRFNGANIGTSTAATVLTLSDTGVTLATNSATITGTTGRDHEHERVCGRGGCAVHWS